MMCLRLHLLGDPEGFASHKGKELHINLLCRIWHSIHYPIEEKTARTSPQAADSQITSASCAIPKAYLRWGTLFGRTECSILVINSSCFFKDANNKV